MNTQEIQDWEKKFDDLLTQYLKAFLLAQQTGDMSENKKWDKKMIKFISKLLAEQKELIKEKIIERIDINSMEIEELNDIIKNI